MQLTIDLRITGCQTRCWHCYVEGGPGPRMSFSQIVDVGAFLRRAIPRLGERFEHVYPYLDLEPVSHPEVVKVLRFFASEGIFPFNAFVPTTGVALARRSDYREVLDVCKELGVKGFEFTLHGPQDVHNEAVQHRRALDLQLVSLERIREYGFLAQSNVIVSKKLVQHFEEVCRFLAAHAYDRVRLTVPHFEPTERLRVFEDHRAEMHDIAEIAGHELFRTCINSDFWTTYEDCTENALLEQVADFDGTWDDMVNRFPQWVFITVVPGLDVYYGNGDLLHRKIGNLRETDAQELIESVAGLKSNYCINGYYDTDGLPPPRTVLRDFGRWESERIYPSLDDIVMLCMDRYQMDRRGVRF